MSPEKHTSVHQKIHTKMCIAAPFLKIPNNNRMNRKLCYRHIIEYYTAMRMNKLLL